MGGGDDDIRKFHRIMRETVQREDLLGDLSEMEGDPRAGRRPIYLTAGELMMLIQVLGRFENWVKPTHPELADAANGLMMTIMKRGGETFAWAPGEEPPADYGAPGE